MSSPLTRAERATVRRLYVDEKLSTTEVGRRIGRRQATVHKYLAGMGLTRSRSEARRTMLDRTGHGERIESGLRLVESGRCSMRQAAAAAGLQKGTICRHARAAGITSRYGKGRPPTLLDCPRKADLVRQAGGLFAQRQTFREIAAALGVHEVTAYNYVRCYFERVMGMAYPGQTRRAVTRRAEVVRMTNQGQTATQIAEALHVSTATVYRDRSLAA